MVTAVVGPACKRFGKTAGFGDFDACEFHCRNAARAGRERLRFDDASRGDEIIATEFPRPASPACNLVTASDAPD